VSTRLDIHEEGTCVGFDTEHAPSLGPFTWKVTFRTSLPDTGGYVHGARQRQEQIERALIARALSVATEEEAAAAGWVRKKDC
jgi:hypothetical protein